MNVRASERGESDDGVIRMIRDDRMRRNGQDTGGRSRAPSSNLDVIHRNKGSDVQILYRDIDNEGVDSQLPSIHVSGTKGHS